MYFKEDILKAAFGNMVDTVFRAIVFNGTRFRHILDHDFFNGFSQSDYQDGFQGF